MYNIFGIYDDPGHEFEKLTMIDNFFLVYFLF